MDPLDDIVRDAMKALEGASTPRDYFDHLPDRIHVRLEGSMQSETITRSPDGSRTDAPVHREEDSGLHDIKALAQTTRNRISRRQTSQHDLDDSLLTTSQSGLHAVALPDPAKMVQLPTVEEARRLARTSAGMPAVDPDDLEARSERPAIAAREPARERSKGVPVWIWAGGGLAAAAAAVMAFVVLGGEETAGDKASESTAAKEAPAAAAGPARAEDRAATPSAEPAPAPPPMPADEGVTASGVTTEPIAADPAQAPAETEVEAAKPEADRGKRKERKDSRGSDDKADAEKPDKPDVKPDAKKVKNDGRGAGGGGEKKLEGAVLGEGDKDELGIGDALLGGGKAKEEAPAKTELTNQEVRDGLDAITGKAKACYGSTGQTGTVKVKLTIAPSGKVSKASASGDLAGTPAADCVVAAVKAASFPAWDGAPKSTSFVVLLSD
jgi:hypothetical protein